MKIRVLILHTSVGYGIKVTAQNIFEELQENGRFEPKILDIQTVEKGLFALILEKVYLAILEKISFLWGFLYNSRIILALALLSRKLLAAFNSKKVFKIIQEFQPQIIVCTQTSPSGIVAFLKSRGKFQGKLVSVFSDYHLHRFWLYDEADLLVCNIAEQVQELRRLGIPEKKIALTGMIVGKRFRKPLSRQTACKQFGLFPNLPTVLVSAGRRGLIATKKVYQALLASPKSFQIAVVTGKNQKLEKEIRAISIPPHHPVRVLGFVTNQDVLMSAADVIISKPGGPTIAEAVAKHLPIILTDAHPGHEAANLAFLTRHQIVQYAKTPEEAKNQVEEILAGRFPKTWEKAIRTILDPPGAVSISQALAAL